MSGSSRGGLIGRLADEYELAWRQSPPVAIDSHYSKLIQGEASILDPAGRISLLEELIKLDLEFRWRAQNAPRWRIGDYLARFPELQQAAGSLTSLIGEEFRVRWRCGDKPSRQTYVQSFPQLEPRLSALLRKIESDFPGQHHPEQPESPGTKPYVSKRGDPAEPAAPPSHQATGAVPSIPGYEITGVLGRGGMGVVYKARDLKLDRLVALKMILSGVHAAGDELDRFRHEAKAVAKLKHPNIVQIHELGECDNRLYFALEYVEGGTLSKALSGNPQQARVAAKQIASLAQAVQHAHDAGIVHRDLKPGNVLLAAAPNSPGELPPDAVLKITDFGLAKQTGEGGDHTRTGMIIGTPSYMAPEQAMGMTKQIGPRSDVYALGAILYEMLVGRPPFKGATTIETLDQVRKQDPVSPRLLQPSLPRDLETICLKCLRKEPAGRYFSAAELADDLGRYSRNEPIKARPVNAAVRAWKFYRRNPWLVRSAAIVAFFLVLATVASIVAANQFRMRANEERRNGYADKIGNAEGELSRNLDFSRAESLLQGCPADLRGWEWYYLMRQLDGARAPIRGHDAGLWCAAISPDGKEIASASIDGRVKLWSVADQRLLGTYEGHARKLAGIDTGTARVLQDSADRALNFVTLGTVSSGVSKIPKHISPVIRVAYSPDGRLVASGALDPNVNSPRDSIGTVHVWTRDMKLVSSFSEHKTLITAVSFSPDSKRIASAGMDADHTWKLWDAETGKLIRSVSGHTGWVTQVRFSPDGRTAASCSIDGTAKIWNLDTFETTRTISDHEAAVRDLAFSADGKKLATAGMDDTVRIWDLAGTTKPVILQGHTGSALGVAFHPDGKRLATAGFDRTVRIWDTETGKQKLALYGHEDVVWTVEFSPDGNQLVSASFDGAVRVWDAAPVVEQSQPGQFAIRDHEKKVNRLAISSDGKRLATASSDKTVKVWDAWSGERQLELRGHSGAVWGVAFSPKDDLIASASWDTTVRVWDAATGRELHALSSNGMPIHCVAFHPDGRRLAAGCWDGTLRVWDARTGAELPAPKGHFFPVLSIAYSPDGSMLATGSGDRSIELWNADSNRSLGKLEVHSATVYGIAFNSDGSRIAGASWDKTISLWNPRALGNPIRIFGGPSDPDSHSDYVYGVAFSPDGHRIASVSNDKTLKIWNADNGQLLHTYRHHGVIWDVRFHPDGQRVATACWNQNAWVRIWNIGK